MASEAAGALLAGALWPVVMLDLAQLRAIPQPVTRLQAQFEVPASPAAGPASAALALTLWHQS